MIQEVYWGRQLLDYVSRHSLLQIQMEVDIIFGDGNAAAENLFAKHGLKSKFFINVCDKLG